MIQRLEWFQWHLHSRAWHKSIVYCHRRRSLQPKQNKQSLQLCHKRICLGPLVFDYLRFVQVRFHDNTVQAYYLSSSKYLVTLIIALKFYVNKDDFKGAELINYPLVHSLLSMSFQFCQCCSQLLSCRPGVSCTLRLWFHKYHSCEKSEQYPSKPLLVCCLSKLVNVKSKSDLDSLSDNHGA